MEDALGADCSTWLRDQLAPRSRQRAGAVTGAQRYPPAMPTAKAIVEHMHDWLIGTPAGQWVSMGLFATGEYGIPAGVVFSYPATCNRGVHSVVRGLQLPPAIWQHIDASHAGLLQERRLVRDYL